MRRTRVHLLDGKAYVAAEALHRCVVEILMFIVHWYVTSKALVMIASGIPCSDHRVESEFCSGIASLAVPNLEGKVQRRIGRVLVCKINLHIRENLHYAWRGSCIQ